MVRLRTAEFHILIEWKKAELEEVLDDDGDLEEIKTHLQII